MTFQTTESNSGAALIDDLGGLLSRGHSYLATLTTDEFFAPQGQAWSPAEHIRHLRLSALPVVLSLRLPKPLLLVAFKRPRHPSRSFGEIRARYREALERGGKAGIFTPRRESALRDPAGRRTRIMLGWSSATHALQRGIARWAEADLDQYRLPHPLLGGLTMREMLAFTVYHTVHHLNRIAERHEAARA